LLPELSLTVVGSVNLDLVARAERLPRPGETLTDATFERHPGGKGANQAVAGNVLCQLEIPVATVASAARGAERFFLNAAPAKELPAEVVQTAEVVVVNRYELEALPETPRLTALTLGAEGAALLENGTEIARAAAAPVRAVDGTAAGDAFTACLVVSLLEGRDREEALRRACAAGASAASRPGAQPSLPTARDVDEMLAHIPLEERR
jgi:ribokinase